MRSTDGEGRSIRSDALYPALSGEWEVLVTRNEDISGFPLVGRWPKVALIDLLRRPTLSTRILLTTHGAFKFRFGRDASFPAVVVIRHQYPTLIGPARLGRLEHKEDFTADRHRRTAEGGPK